jgi:hypothetical protein
MTAAPYDEIADWYEHEFLGRPANAGDDPLGIKSALRDLLGPGSGVRLETVIFGQRLRGEASDHVDGMAGRGAVGVRHRGGQRLTIL